MTHGIPHSRKEAVTKLETRRVSEDCTESSSTSLTRRVTILAFGSVRLKKSQPQRVVISVSSSREVISGQTIDRIHYRNSFIQIPFMKLFQLQRGLIPLMVSNPHSGTFIPPEIASTMSPEALAKRDTDWFLARLYDFPVLQKAGMIKANLSRYVIDLNRRSDGTSLYPGKSTTGLCPRITFENEPIYLAGNEPDDSEVGKRVEHFWRPYHDQLNEELDRLIDQFGYVVFLDVHSIADQVPMLFEGSIPCLNFGTNHGKSCSVEFQSAIEQFGNSLEGVSWVSNGRFIGGYITRQYGQKPNVNAVQLELNRSSYMDEQALQWNDEGAAIIGPVLESFVKMLSEWKPS